MAATVTVRAKAFGDSRIVYLSQLLGCSWNDAFIRMIRLWSVCAEKQSDRPEVRHIRACLEHPQGEVHLVESGLGDDSRRDPKLPDGVIRVRGCDETDWHYATIELQAQVDAGRARAECAFRDRTGRFMPNAPPRDLSSQSPASVCPDLISGSADLIRPELPDLQASVDLEREKAIAAASMPCSGPLSSRADRRRKLFFDAWSYAGLKHEELKSSGVDPSARKCWSGTPNPSSTEAQDLLARIDELAPDGSSNPSRAFALAGEVIRNRVDVAAATARRDQTLRWFTPARMWNAKSFAIDKDLSPEQAGQPRGPRPPSSRPDSDAPRKIPTAR